MTARLQGPLRITGIVIAMLLCVGVAFADDCDFARENFQLYIDNCAATDNCASMTRMESIVADNCGPGPQGAAAPAQPAPQPPPPPPRDVALAANDVSQLQQALAALGFSSGAADGVVGPATRRAVTAFQQAAGLAATGDIDQATLEAILAAFASLPPPPAAPTGDACRVLAELKAMDFEREWRGAVARFRGLTELRADLQELRAELQSDTYFEAGMWREATASLLQAASTTGNLTANLIRLNPATSSITSIVSELFDLYKKSDQILRGAYEQTLSELWIDLKAKTNPGFQAVKTAYDFANDMHTLSEIPEGFRQMRDAAAEALAKLDAQLASIERDLASSRAWVETAGTAVAVMEQKCAAEQGPAQRLP